MQKEERPNQAVPDGDDFLLVERVLAGDRRAPLAHILGFTTLPGSYFTFLAISTLTYLVLVEVAKRRLFAQAFS